MDKSLQTIGIRELKAKLPSGHDMRLGDDIFLADVNFQELQKSLDTMNILKYPLRFDGSLTFFCLSGDISVDINLHTYHVRRNTLLVNIPGNIIRVRDIGMEQLRETRFIVVWMSTDFVSGIHMDFNRLFHDSLTFFDNPCLTLNDEQFELAKRYFNLAHSLLGSEIENKKEAITALVSSLFYVFGGIWKSSISQARSTGQPTGPSDRSRLIFDRFIALVTEYHGTQRGMAFYADRLCLTPKYLSKLIKQASGRSAPAWIDAFVILEAKNMLKYSGMNVKEIVYKLNFPNQSVFYKYFKAHTGMTPTEYRNG